MSFCAKKPTTCKYRDCLSFGVLLDSASAPTEAHSPQVDKHTCIRECWPGTDRCAQCIGDFDHCAQQSVTRPMNRGLRRLLDGGAPTTDIHRTEVPGT